MAEGVANDAQSVAAPLVVSCSPKQAGEGDNAVEVLCERRERTELRCRVTDPWKGTIPEPWLFTKT